MQRVTMIVFFFLTALLIIELAFPGAVSDSLSRLQAPPSAPRFVPLE